jgi:hypothetical protein
MSETIQGCVSAVLNLTMDCALMPAQPFQITFPSVASQTSVLVEEGHGKEKDARHLLSVFSKKQHYLR